jgi:AcrR family transcriptional regulator
MDIRPRSRLRCIRERLKNAAAIVCLNGQNMARVREQRSSDRRVRRTQDRLHEALTSLIREQSYETISVKDILARADVGRSTFYTHFADKDELLVSGIRGMLRAVQGHASATATGHERIIAFSHPVFEHIHWHQGTSDTPMAPRARALLHQRLRAVLVDSIAAEIRTQRKPRRTPLMPPELLAEYVAATFIVVLDWWLQKNSALSPAEVDVVFRALVLPALDPA